MTTCPICKHSKNKQLVKLNCGNFDASSLYQYAAIVSCENCGHVFNRLSSREVSNLAVFYNKEYAPSNISAVGLGGMKPGSQNDGATKRYEYLYRFIEPLVATDAKVLDAGCGMGGFLNFLRQKQFNKLYGVDISKGFVDQAAKLKKFDIRIGSVESTSFQDNFFDAMTADNVLEHLTAPQKAFQEARRVLSAGGIFCVVVPDSSRYIKNSFFDFYYFLLREHVQHFDIEHLKMLARANGFELIRSERTNTPLSKKFVLPTIYAAFRLVSAKGKLDIGAKSFELKSGIERYLKRSGEKAERKLKKIKALAKSNRPVYAYGLSSEFLYIYELGLKKCNLVGLIDDTLFKQKHLTVGGRKIYGSERLKEAPADSALIITAFAHTPLLKAKLQKIGYPGTIITL